MKTKIEIKSIFGDVLFEYEKENNTIKDTLEEAVKSDAYLGGANLRGAYLGGANLGDWGKINNSSNILIVGLIGSRNGYTTIYHTDKGIFIQCGCFQGTLNDFVAKVKKTHNGSKHEKDYLAMVEFAKIKFNNHER